MFKRIEIHKWCEEGELIFEALVEKKEVVYTVGGLH
jgi:hypothetical protein